MTTLKAEVRKSGTGKAMRRAGFLPAVVYGRSEKSTPISISALDFAKAFKEAGESGVIVLSGVGTPKNVLVNDVVYDAVSGAIIHADLYAVEKGQTVSVAVPLEFIGVSNAVKMLGGILTKVMHELEVEGEPSDLPHSIIIDISALSDLDSQIHVSDLVLPKGVTAELDGEEVVAMISVAEEEPVEAAPVDLAAIEVEKKGKKEEEAAATEE